VISGIGPFPFQADGEYLGVSERLEVGYRPDAITLVVPVHDPTP
jgi:diacylglycerol kinase family enzyme